MHPGTRPHHTAYTNLTSAPTAAGTAVTPYSRLRLIALAEAVSWAVLLTCSVIKRTTPYTDPVFYAGSIHGGLFVVFLLCATDFGVRRPRVPVNFWYYALFAAVIPFGTLWFDRWLTRLSARRGTASTGLS